MSAYLDGVQGKNRGAVELKVIDQKYRPLRGRL
jgi:hypothetical protein